MIGWQYTQTCVNLGGGGNGSEVAGKDRSNSAGPGSDVQDGGAVVDLVQYRYLGGDGGDDQGPGRIPPPNGTTDHEDDGKTRGRWKVGVPPVVEAMEAAGIHPIWEYIGRRQATIAERVACRPIYELCKEAEWIPVTSWMVWWWIQDAVNEPEEYTHTWFNLSY